mmetsp:Transcript_52303/g.162013  ORF Transcript_52303/g.162013 Transcript_52303/m.162013 type:complete len:214 (+) Transcript_52303:89-730(+)
MTPHCVSAGSIWRKARRPSPWRCLLRSSMASCTACSSWARRGKSTRLAGQPLNTCAGSEVSVGSSAFVVAARSIIISVCFGRGMVSPSFHAVAAKRVSRKKSGTVPTWRCQPDTRKMHSVRKEDRSWQLSPALRNSLGQKSGVAGSLRPKNLSTNFCTYSSPARRSEHSGESTGPNSAARSLSTCALSASWSSIPSSKNGSSGMPSTSPRKPS